jgi:hypothetical protein
MLTSDGALRAVLQQGSRSGPDPLLAEDQPPAPLGRVLRVFSANCIRRPPPRRLVWM